MTVADRLVDYANSRAPDFVIGGHERPYLLRWWLIPRNPVLNVYLHCFLRSDDDRALHSHPWLFNLSWLLRGGYVEHGPRGEMHKRLAGDLKFRWGKAWHRVQLLRAALAIGARPPRPFGPELQCWTLFVTGPRVRSWGFDCNGRFVHWRAFTAPSDSGAVGKGCDA